jgi:hypothetical protein
MPKELTNLLPSERRHTLAREYYMRLGVVAIALVILLVAVGAILLIPTYIFLVGTAQEKEVRLAHIKTALSSADEVALSTRLTALSNDAKALIALSKKPSVSGAARAALLVPRAGVTLSAFTYTPGTTASTLLLTGTASTRDALRAYQLALQSMPNASSVTLPVSVYAKDANIGFTITITLTS